MRIKFSWKFATVLLLFFLDISLGIHVSLFQAIALVFFGSIWVFVLFGLLADVFLISFPVNLILAVLLFLLKNLLLKIKIDTGIAIILSYVLFVFLVRLCQRTFPYINLIWTSSIAQIIYPMLIIIIGNALKKEKFS